jgi:hypothetical protein
MYTDGQIITEKEYIDFVNWANANGNKFYIDMNEDGTYTVREVVVVEPTIEEQNEIIRQTRAGLYAQLVDPLHAQKDKDIIMGEWSEEREQEYIAEVKRLTIKIREENPYIETVD